MKCLFDIETNSKCIYDAEIIEAYFLLEDGSDYHFKSRVDNWSIEAEMIHKIPYSIASTYPDKKQAYRDLLTWVKSKNITDWICFANTNTEYGFMHFDMAVIKVQLDQISENHTLFYKYFSDNITSVHTLARQAARENLFQPLKKKSSTGKMIQQLNQMSVYQALFNKKFENDHNCVNDTNAMVKIYNRLIQLFDENKSDLLWINTSNS